MKDTKLISLLIGAGITLVSGNTSAQAPNLSNEEVLENNIKKHTTYISIEALQDTSCKNMNVGCGNGACSNGGCGCY